MAIASFAVSAGIVVAGITVYNNQEKIRDGVRDRILESVTDALPGLVGGSITDEVPVTLPAPEVPATTDISIPGF